VFAGYMHDPAKTAEALDDEGWLHTGDIGVIDDDGYVRIVDRKKELIITAGGKNISPANLEAALKLITLVGQACAIGDKRPFVSALVTLDPDVEAAVTRVARLLADMGHVVEETGPMDADVESFLPLMQKITANAPMPPFADGRMEPTTRWMRDEGKKHDDARVLAEAKKLERRVLDHFADSDFWLLPTVALLPPLVGAFEGLSGPATLEAVTPLGAFTAPFNVSGQPAASIPAGRSRGGVPIGVQLVAAPGRDRALFALCQAVEDALGASSRATS
jgi:Asp-tRNA(Asn)/Glu-tRNA(Gln) amidotransferase A subunit family amidase